MSLARASAVYAAPIPLRIVLAIVFIWAGLAKLVETMPVRGEEAALLANMGADLPPPSVDAETAEPAEPAVTPPDSVDTPDNLEQLGDDLEGAVRDAGRAIEDAAEEAGEQIEQSLDSLSDQDPGPLTDPDADRADDETTSPEPQPSFAHSAAEYPLPIEVKRLHGVALLTYRSAHPAPAADGTIPPPIWPDWAARDHWPLTLAWITAITELTAGLLCLVGLLTRFSALALVCIMVTAIWLTEIGPAVQSGDTLMGFLPDRPIWEPESWKGLFLMSALAGAALALVFAGPGAISLDHAVLGGPRRDRDEDDDD